MTASRSSGDSFCNAACSSSPASRPANKPSVRECCAVFSSRTAKLLFNSVGYPVLLGSAIVIYQQIPGQPAQPDRERTFACPEAPERLEYAQKHFLGKILRLALLVCKAIADRVHTPGMGFDQLFPGALFSAQAALNQTRLCDPSAAAVAASTHFQAAPIAFELNEVFEFSEIPASAALTLVSTASNCTPSKFNAIRRPDTVKRWMALEVQCAFAVCGSLSTQRFYIARQLPD